MSPPTPIHTLLPTEIFFEIISYLDSPSYIDNHKEEEPYWVFNQDGGFSESDATVALKNASLVCRSWRTAVWPLLFRHIYIRYRDWDPQAASPCEPIGNAIDFLETHRTPLQRVAKSISLFLLPSQKVLQRSREAREEAHSDGTPVQFMLTGKTLEVERAHKKKCPEYNPYGPLLDAINPLKLERMIFVGSSLAIGAFLHGYYACFPPVDFPGRRLHVITMCVDQNHTRRETSWSQSPVPLKRFLAAGMGGWVFFNDWLSLELDHYLHSANGTKKYNREWTPDLPMTLTDWPMGAQAQDAFGHYTSAADYPGPPVGWLP